MRQSCVKFSILKLGETTWGFFLGLSSGLVLVIVNVVADFVRLCDVRNHFFRELFDVEIQVLFNVFNRHSDGPLDLWQELLWLLHVRDWELELCRLHETHLSEKLLSFLFSDDVFRFLVVLEAQRSWVESERIQELFAPIIWVHVELEWLVTLRLLRFWSLFQCCDFTLCF